ncbi:excalibur calcium-binding domain-containing protein [Streptomyces sp. NPDC059881]|uniref:excalibur calcium-binding domain-containing protein n=1 Tax=Streptomyces sp. NPDC059881 TaxID=3346986 RepID=UPI003647634D
MSPGAEPHGQFVNCAQARAAGAAPVREGKPGYGPHLGRTETASGPTGGYSQRGRRRGR